MDYYALRTAASKIVPRTVRLTKIHKHASLVKNKRKTNYSEYKITQNQQIHKSVLLNTEVINNFLEISCRAAACPMPLNLDVWDGTICPYGCIYCYANLFKSTLYNFFFDNSKSVGVRHCNPDMYKRELDKLMVCRGKDPHNYTNLHAKSIAMEMPVRFGIRFEDFLKQEERSGISLELLKYLTAHDYPTMINTKSDLIGTDPYIDAMKGNAGGAAVHITLISSNDKTLKALEPGAPSYDARVQAMKNLSSGGIRVVARIEPYLVFLCDSKDEVEKYITDVWNAGVRHITFDTYSYSAKDQIIKKAFVNKGYDWDRMFELGCESQGIGSMLLGEFMKLFRKKGFSCSTFDIGNIPDNDQDVCCEVSDLFKGGFNWGSIVIAIRFIKSRKGQPTTWQDYENYVENKGGFLNEEIKKDVRLMWNGMGSLSAYSVQWSKNMEAVGYDGDTIWKFDEKSDFRKDVLEGCVL